MAIKKAELESMNELLSNGKTIADLAKMFPQYDYWEIYWQVSDYSFLGKKRIITNRIKKLITTKTQIEREELAAEAQTLLDELYAQLKSNSAKLIDIDHILRG